MSCRSRTRSELPSRTTRPSTVKRSLDRFRSCSRRGRSFGRGGEGVRRNALRLKPLTGWSWWTAFDAFDAIRRAQLAWGVSHSVHDTLLGQVGPGERRWTGIVSDADAYVNQRTCGATSSRSFAHMGPLFPSQSEYCGGRTLEG